MWQTLGIKTNRLTGIGFTIISLHSNADAICKDGWRSRSEGSGTCSHHGGVANWLSDGTNDFWSGGWPFILIGAAIVIFVLMSLGSSNTRSPPNSIRPTKRLKRDVEKKTESIPRLLNYNEHSNVILEIEDELARTISDFSMVDVDSISLIAQQILFEVFMIKGLNSNELHKALYGLTESSKLFPYIYRINLEYVSKSVQVKNLIKVYPFYITERKMGHYPKKSLNRAIIECFTGGSLDL